MSPLKFIFDSQVNPKPPNHRQHDRDHLRQLSWPRKGITSPSAFLFGLLSVFVVTLALSVSLLSQTNPNDSIVAALRSSQYQRALELIQQELKKSPHDTNLLIWKGFALERTGQIQSALGAYLAALDNSPKNLAALEGAAQLEYKANNPRAIKYLQEILALKPDSDTSHAMLGVMLFRRNDCKGAVEHFRLSEGLVNQQPGALTFYGSCLLQLGKVDEAISTFSRQQSLMPDDPHVRYNLAICQLAGQHTVEAIATLEPLLAMNTPNASVLSLASAAYERSGDTPTAVNLLRKAILADPQSEDLYLNFGTLSYNHKSFQVGIEVIDAGLTQIPRSAKLYLMRGILYVQIGKYAEAQADFETAHQLDPSQTSAGIAKGLAQMQESRLEEALQTTEAQLNASPNDAFLYYLKAEILSRRGARSGTEQFKAALESAQRAVRLKPDFILARDLLANLYLKTGDGAKAISQSRESLRQDPGDEVALYHLIQALRTNKGAQNEINQLTSRLAAAREKSKKEEAEETRYRLYIPASGVPESDRDATRPE